MKKALTSLRVTVAVAALELATLNHPKADEYFDRVIHIEVDEPLMDFERRFPPGFGATHEESRKNALAIWTVNTTLASSDTRTGGCSQEITDAWKGGRKGVTPRHDEFDRFRFAAAVCGDLNRVGEPFLFLNCNAPFRRLCVSSWARVPLKNVSGTFVVPVQINGAITLDFVVDSGASDVSVPSDVFSTLVRTGTIKDTDITGKQTYILADGSKTQSVTFTIKSLTVGDRVVESVRGSVASSQSPLLLGQSFFERFKLWSFDNTNHELLLD
jgi:clan AA aspartic protease (TIGR02281 family)